MEAKSVLDQAVRDAKINVILDAARAVFAERDFHETRLEDIAERAGFSKASLYNYFKDKEAIFLALAVREYRRMFLQMQESLDAAHPFIENLRRSLRISFTHFGENFATILAISNFRMMRIADAEAFCTEHEYRIEGEFRSAFTELTTMFEKFLCSARARGEFASPLSDAIINRYITSLIRGTVIAWKIEGKMGDVEAEIETIVDFVIHGLQYRIA